MNIIIVTDKDFSNHDQIILKDRRLEHIRKVHRATVGQTLKIGLLNGLIGHGDITEISKEKVVFNNLSFSQNPPKPSLITLCVALPRPQTIKKLLQGAIELGVKKIIFFNSKRVEKSFWDSSILEKEALQQQILLGLEQAVDTIAPEISFVPHFSSFVKNTLPELAESNSLIFAHPNSNKKCTYAKASSPTTIIIGPEGGFIPDEVIKLQESHCQSIDLGERILRVEHAAFMLLSCLS